jgi:Sulfatase
VVLSSTGRHALADDREPVVDEPSGDHAERRTATPPPVADRPRWRVVAGWVLSVLAGLLLYAALVIPNQLEQVTPGAFVRIPFEALVGVLVVLLLPARARVVVAAGAGAVLGLLTILRIADLGFTTVLDRPFDPVFDWSALGNAETFLKDSIGEAGATAAAVGTGLLAVALVVAMTLAAMRLSRLVGRHRTATARVLPVVGVAWVACFALGAQIVTPVPVASWGAASLAYHTSAQVPATLHNHDMFVAQAAQPDPFGATPPDQLLTGLRGKDVLLTFIESYGRSAIEDPAMGAVVDPVLDQGTQQLAAAGFAARSAFLTSPVHGGGSWLAHSTLLSGLWVTNQHDYDTLTGGDRLTLPKAFQESGSRTVGAMPGLTGAWPESKFYGIDNLYDANHLGYAGQSFTGFHTPDQYTLSAFQQLEHGVANHPPMMAEIVLVSSHWPWAPLPRYVDWNAVGNGSVYNGQQDQGDPVDVVWSDPARVKAAYAQSVQYTLTSLITWMQKYADDNTVLVFLGDHQPAPVVSGDTGDDVPITVVAKDPAVLDRIADWHWDEGLRPAPDAPVWRMDAFRDRFLTAFGPQPNPAPAN